MTIKQRLGRLARDSFYREYLRLSFLLGRRPRYVPCAISAHGRRLNIPDAASFLSGYRSIFLEQVYSFKSDRKDPVIIDLGANIGLSVLYFKGLYPHAEICALEADPGIFKYLTDNVHGNGFKDVTLMNTAAWHKKTILKFLPEGADAGRVASTPGKDGGIEVEAIDAAELIAGRKVDLLKIDIEGAEVDVLDHCREALSGVQRIFVEYHSRADAPQRLSSLLEVLGSRGFRYHVQSAWTSPHPFRERRLLAGYDMLLNIFAWRKER